MLAERLTRKIHIKSYWVRLILGSAVTALLISLGMVVILEILNLDINPGIIAALAAVGASIYASRIRRG